MLLIYPPVTKACEPPGGIPILSAVLKAHGIKCKTIDMNLEGQNYLLDLYFKKYPKKENYRNLIRSHLGYKNVDKYIKVVKELERGLKYSSDCDNQI